MSNRKEEFDDVDDLIKNEQKNKNTAWVNENENNFKENENNYSSIEKKSDYDLDNNSQINIDLFHHLNIFQSLLSHIAKISNKGIKAHSELKANISNLESRVNLKMSKDTFDSKYRIFEQRISDEVILIR